MAQAQQAGEPNRSQPHPVKKNRFAHVANTKYGMGDHYGTGIRAKIGKVRRDSVNVSSSNSKKLKTPPKQLA